MDMKKMQQTLSTLNELLQALTRKGIQFEGAGIEFFTSEDVYDVCICVDPTQMQAVLDTAMEVSKQSPFDFPEWMTLSVSEYQYEVEQRPMAQA